MKTEELEQYIGAKFTDGEGEWTVTERTVKGKRRILKVDGGKRRAVTDVDLNRLERLGGWATTPTVAVDEDGPNVREIVGKATELHYRKGDPKSLVTIKDKDGNFHTAMVAGTFPFSQILLRAKIPGKDYGLKSDYVSDSDFNQRLTEPQRDSVLTRVLAADRYLLYRIVDADPSSPIATRQLDWVLAALTERWAKVKATTVAPLVKGAFSEEVDIDISPSDGIYGGYLSARYPDKPRAPVRSYLRIDCGLLDGQNAVTIFAYATLNKDSTVRFTFDVRHKLRPLVDSFFWARKVHVGDVDELDLFKDAIQRAEAAVRKIEDLVIHAKNTILTGDEMVKIALYYLNREIISKKTWEKTIAVLTGKVPKEGQTFKPATVWRFSRAFGWLAENGDDVKDGVKKELQRIAGELLAIAPKMTEFIDLCEGKKEAD